MGATNKIQINKKLRTWFGTAVFAGARSFYSVLIQPRSMEEDSRRKEIILNIILCAVILLSFLLDITILVSEIRERTSYEGVDFFSFSAGLVFLLLLLYLSRTGLYRAASYGLFLACSVMVIYGAWHWGVDLPAAMLGYSFLIIMSGVLFNAKFATWVAVADILYVASVGYLQLKGNIYVWNAWRKESFEMYDLFFFVSMLMAILALSWISNKQIEKSLDRARKSEKLLLAEKDVLEIKVEERTREIKSMQAEQTTQLYRFAEFGKMASGLFHDLANPVTSVSLNAHMLKDSNVLNPKARHQLEQLHQSSRRMENFLASIKKQLQQKKIAITFSLNQEIKDALAILRHKAMTGKVVLEFYSAREIRMFGDNFKFHQIVLNLVSNAIDSYSNKNEPEKFKPITVELDEIDRISFLKVIDRGSGINKDDMEKIFDPFFSTKTGFSGIGLFMVKEIIEKEFCGKIVARNLLPFGTEFIVEIPLGKN